MPDKMTPAQVVARGRVAGLAINGKATDSIVMNLDGPEGDSHSGALYDAGVPEYKGDGISLGRHGEHSDARWAGVTRPLSATHRAWTAMSAEEQAVGADGLGIEKFPIGGALETLVIEGIGHFSAVPPGWELAFFRDDTQQCRLLIREPNTPCANAARALYWKLHGDDASVPSTFPKEFIEVFQLSRGLMGSVIYPGEIRLDDEVRLLSAKCHPARDIWESQVPMP